MLFKLDPNTFLNLDTGLLIKFDQIPDRTGQPSLIADVSPPGVRPHTLRGRQAEALFDLLEALAAYHPDDVIDIVGEPAAVIGGVGR